MQVWLKLDKNTGHFTWRPKYIYTVDREIHSSTTHREQTLMSPWQKWLHKHNPMLHVTSCVHYLV